MVWIEAVHAQLFEVRQSLAQPVVAEIPILDRNVLLDNHLPLLPHDQSHQRHGIPPG